MSNLKERFKHSYLSNYTDIPEGSWQILPLLFIEAFVMSLSFFIAVFFKKALNFTPLQIGTLISIQLAGTFIGSALTGFLSTRFKPIQLTLVGFMSLALTFMSLSASPGFQTAMPIMFLMGVASVLMMVSNLTAFVRTSSLSGKKNQLIVLQGVIFNLTVSITAFVVSFTEANTLKHLFAAISIILLLTAIIVHRITPAQSVQYKPNKSNYKPDIKLFWLLIPNLFFYGLTFAVVKVFYATDIQQHIHSPWLQSALLSLNPFMVVFIQPWLIQKVSNKGNDVKQLLLGGILVSLGYACFGFSTNIAILSLLIITATLGELIYSPLSKKFASQLFGEGYEGSGLATWKLSFYASGMIGASLSGYMAEHFSHTIAWSLCAMLALTCIIQWGFLFSSPATETVQAT